MAEELEAMRSKLSFTEEEGEGIELGSNNTRAAREVGKNYAIMKILTLRCMRKLRFFEKKPENVMENK